MGNGYANCVHTLLMTDIKETISIEEIRDKLTPMFQDIGLRLVLLFGSAATGKQHKKKRY